jgi:hypothetical protein
MATIINATNINEAIQIALNGKERGEWNLFRGQTNANWQVSSSLERLTPEMRENALQEFIRFHNWAKEEPSMRDYFSQTDSVWAIAQHYGIPTGFIDFTDDPRVAAFFASDAKEIPPSGQNAAIVCLNVEDFTEFWESTWPHFAKRDPDAMPPEIVRIDVRNLWRLQQQKGCFLWNSLADIEKFYDFDRIVFPFTGSAPSLPSHNEIYPLNQSDLERRIAAHFLNERMIKSRRYMEELSANILIVEVPESQYDIRSWCAAYSEDESDWENIDHWKLGATQHAADALPGAVLDLGADSTSEVLAELLRSAITPAFVTDNRNSALQFADPLNFGVGILTRVRRLWNGMRTLPYTADEIVTALQMTLDLYPMKQSGLSLRDAFGEDGAYVEMCSSSDGRGSYSRAALHFKEFHRACRTAFVAAVNADQDLDDEVLGWHLLQRMARPRQRFTFEGLRKLMVEELIPTQVVWRAMSEGNDALTEVIYFSPTDFEIFGLA